MKIECQVGINSKFFEQFRMYLITFEYVNDIKENTDYSKC